MELLEAIQVLDDVDFAKTNLDPDVVQAISTLLIQSKIRARSNVRLEVPQGVVETVTD